jgi:hypothetical protein
MKAKILFCVIVCLAIGRATVLPAQDVLPGYTQARRFAPSNAEQLLFSYTLSPHYFNNSSKFWYEYKTSDGARWYVVDPEAAKKQPLFDLDELAAQITETVKDPFTAQQLPLRNLKLEDDDHTFTFEITSSTAKTFYFSYDYPSRRLTETEENKASRERWGNVSPGKKHVLYAKDLNLYCITYADYERLQKNPKDSLVNETQLTTDGTEDFAFGMPRNRMNTDSLYDHKRKPVQGNWSPDGRYFAAILTDQRAVGNLWVVNSVAKPRPTLETYKYQLPGEAGSPVAHLYLFDLETRCRKELDAA